MPWTEVQDGGRTAFRWLVALSLLLSGLLYLRTLDYPFTNWDDPEYVSENVGLQALSWKALCTEFGRSVMANYHPVTMLSYSLDLALFGMEPGAMHGTNLFLHLLNIALVATFLLRLTGNPLLAGIAVLLWAVHPLRVESVAWLSGRKDLLMLFFGSLMLLAYQSWQRTGYRWAYPASVLAFLLACLAKGMAVSLVPVLLLMDHFSSEQPGARRIMLTKIPFVVIAIVIGLITIEAQSEVIAKSGHDIPLVQRFLLGPANVVAYMVNTIAPVQLSAKYVYPIRNGSLPEWYTWVGSIALLGLFWCGLRTWRDRAKGIGVWRFGLWFFVLGLLPVLQWLPVGGAIRADRYTYMAGLGASLLLAWILLSTLERLAPERSRAAALSIVGVFGFWLIYITSERIPVWSSAILVRTDMIASDPMGHLGYLDRAKSFAAVNDSTAALADFNKAVARAGKKEFLPRYERGIHHLSHERYGLAMQDFLVIFQEKTNMPGLVPNMLFAQLGLGMYADVERNATRALAVDSASLDLLNIRAACRIEQGRSSEAFTDLLRSIQLDRTRQETWLLMAWAFRSHGSPEMACRILDAGLVTGPMTHPWLQRVFRSERDHCPRASGDPPGPQSITPS